MWRNASALGSPGTRQARALRHVCLALLRCLAAADGDGLWFGRGAQQGRGEYVGRALHHVLREMQAGGVKLVYSSELVHPDLRVVAEPRARAPRKRLAELLKAPRLRRGAAP